MTLNCQRLRSAANRRTLFEWLNCFAPQIVCLLETHSTSHAEFQGWVSDAEADGHCGLGYRCVSSPGTARSSGVAVLFQLSFEALHSFRDSEG